MAQLGIQHQIRRDTSTNISAYTGPTGEYLADTSYNRIILHDGATQGGFPTAMNASQSITASTTIAVTTAMAMVLSTAAGIVITLPAVSAYPAGQMLSVVDGLANSSNANIVITTNSTTESIKSSTGGSSTSWTLSVSGLAFRALSNSSLAWVGAVNY